MKFKTFKTDYLFEFYKDFVHKEQPKSWVYINRWLFYLLFRYSIVLLIYIDMHPFYKLILFAVVQTLIIILTFCFSRNIEDGLFFQLFNLQNIMIAIFMLVSYNADVQTL